MPHSEQNIAVAEKAEDEVVAKAEEQEPLDVLDLPQLYQKPSAEILLSILADLTLQPRSWDKVTVSGGTKRKIRSQGIPTYLTKIVSSPLAWILSDEEKEQVWEAASQRLSERSGRTAMGAIERTFRIPLAASAVGASNGDTGDVVSIKLREPALTGDNLGLKTWASSFLLAKRLTLLKDAGLPNIGPQEQILELGSGTGLVGLAAAAVFQRRVILTDLLEIVPNLEHNINCNADTLNEANASARSGILDWTQPSSLTLHSSSEHDSPSHPPHSFPLILAADIIYSAIHPTLFVAAVDAQLSRHPDARVVIELPLRDAYATERADLVERMEGLGLRRVDEGEEVGYDDWGARRGEDEEELDEVRCWWGVWGWGRAGGVGLNV